MTEKYVIRKEICPVCPNRPVKWRASGYCFTACRDTWEEALQWVQNELD